MQPKSDAQLLRDYLTHGSEKAFAELAARHANLVYSAARRQVESADMASEVAQRVFVALARNASNLIQTLAPDAALAGWLCRSTRNICLNHRRDEFRRSTREQHAMEQLHSAHNPTPDWERLGPVLDEAMSELADSDYDALVLRFYEERDLRTVGRALGITEDAAQKRVARALEKLRDLLSARGIGASTAALSLALAANAIHAAPAGLAAALSSAAVLAGTAAGATTVTLTKAITMTTLQKTLIGTALAATVGTGLYQANQAAKLRENLNAAVSRNATLERALVNERDRTAQMAALRQQSERRETAELARLRAELARLRDAKRDLDNLPGAIQEQPGEPAPEAPDTQLLASGWTDAGFATPEAALRTRAWSITTGNRQRFKDSIHITEAARAKLEDLFIQMAENSNAPDKERYIQDILKNEYGVEEGFLFPLMAEHKRANYSGYRILSQQSPADDQLVIELAKETSDGSTRNETLTFRRMDEKWKVFIDETILANLMKK